MHKYVQKKKKEGSENMQAIRVEAQESEEALCRASCS
jgi:hypothetical protein